MNVSPARVLVLLLVSWLVAGQSRADYMNWSYSTSAVPPGFSVTGANNGSGSVQLTPFTNVAGASSIAALAYQTAATTPVTFSAQSTAFTLSMTITDNATHDSGSLSFTGSISGTLSPTSSTLVETFAVTQKSLTLDGHIYTVTLPSSVALAPPTSPQHNIMATVSVSNSGGVQGVPEPTSLMLGGLGVCLMGLGGWWKRRPKAARQAA
jgi:hypothetical protein